MLRILRIWHCQGISLDLEASSETEENRIQDILVYIDRHSQENINIEELAHHYNMSYSYFAKNVPEILWPELQAVYRVHPAEQGGKISCFSPITT